MEALRNPTIYLGGLRIDEPVTTGTDIIVAIVGILAFVYTRSEKQDTHIKLYRWFFLLTGISTLVSSLIGHAFSYYFGIESRVYGWMIGIVSAGISPFAAIYHVRSILQKTTFTVLLWLNAVEFIAALLITFLANTFIVVEIHSAVALLLMLTTLESIYYSKTKSVLSKYLIMGVGFCIVAVVCHIAKLAISPWFNHLDLSHVFMGLALYTMYTGVKKEIHTKPL